MENKSSTTDKTKLQSTVPERETTAAVGSIFSITILPRNAVTVQGRRRVMVIKFIHLHFGLSVGCTALVGGEGA